MLFWCALIIIFDDYDLAVAGEIRDIVASGSAVLRAAWPLTMYFGPEPGAARARCAVRAGVAAQKVHSAVARIEARIREMRRICIGARRVAP